MKSLQKQIKESVAITESAQFDTEIALNVPVTVDFQIRTFFVSKNSLEKFERLLDKDLLTKFVITEMKTTFLKKCHDLARKITELKISFSEDRVDFFVEFEYGDKEVSKYISINIDYTENGFTLIPGTIVTSDKSFIPQIELFISKKLSKQNEKTITLILERFLELVDDTLFDF